MNDFTNNLHRSLWPWSFEHPFAGGKNLQMEPACNFAVSHLNVDEQMISPDVTRIKPFI